MNTFHRTKEKRENGGFTLVETLVAISIFTLSVLIMLSVLSKGISDTAYAKKKLIASYLAQEGIEYMRNMRDTYMLYSATRRRGLERLPQQARRRLLPVRERLLLQRRQPLLARRPDARHQDADVLLRRLVPADEI
ncbi:MAG: prepilin-type N-terminal cleavage/methylation domain-containing protein [bacterium]